jgi:hypothetical protein
VGQHHRLESGRPNKGITLTASGHEIAGQRRCRAVVRLRYQDGATEDHHWKNGEHFADFSMWERGNEFERIDVPGSSFAIEVKKNTQVRYLMIRPTSPEKVIESVDFIKGEQDNLASPAIIAVTLEKADN